MPRYAKSIDDLEDGQLVLWDGKVYAVWDLTDRQKVKLVPYDTRIICEGYTETADQDAVIVPVRQIQIPNPVYAGQEIMRSFFRLDVMPWELLLQGKYPFSDENGKLSITEEDLLCLLDRLDMFQSTFLLEAWRKTFMACNDMRSHYRISVPKDDDPGFTFHFFADNVFDFINLFDPEEDDWTWLRKLKDCYLQSKGKPLSHMLLPDELKSPMAHSLEEYCRKHPVTDEIRKCYIRLLDECLEMGNSQICAYAYYGGNEIVGCDWHKAEQALLKEFDPDRDPPSGNEWAANSLGYIYGSDRLGKPDYQKAFICFLYAAGKGVTEATYKLSDLYRQGLGTRKDPEMAWTILNGLYRLTDKRRIAHGKYADIMLRMGYCYRDGIGVEPDPEKAMSFFLKAKRGIEERMKQHPQFGDETVARNIQKAIESIK